MAELASEFEREKLLKDHQFREREIILKERETAVKERETTIKENESALRERETVAKEGELEIKRKEFKRNMMFGPLSLAIIGATLAGGWNAWVADHNAKAQRQLEQAQAEHARVSSALNDPTNSIKKLQFLIAVDLITEEPLRSRIENYIDQDVQTSQQTRPAAPPSRPVVARGRVDSNWLGGGNNPTDVCNGLLVTIRGNYPGKDARISSTSEDYKKDFLGHVTYQYHCDYEVF